MGRFSNLFGSFASASQRSLTDSLDNVASAGANRIARDAAAEAARKAAAEALAKKTAKEAAEATAEATRETALKRLSSFGGVVGGTVAKGAQRCTKNPKLCAGFVAGTATGIYLTSEYVDKNEDYTNCVGLCSPTNIDQVHDNPNARPEYQTHSLDEDENSDAYTPKCTEEQSETLNGCKTYCENTCEGLMPSMMDDLAAPVKELYNQAADLFSELFGEFGQIALAIILLPLIIMILIPLLKFIVTKLFFGSFSSNKNTYSNNYDNPYSTYNYGPPQMMQPYMMQPQMMQPYMQRSF